MRPRLILTALTAATLVGAPLLGTASAMSPAALTTAVPSTTAVTGAALPGTAPLLLKGATVVGNAAPDVRQQVILSLALRDQAGLKALLAAQQVRGNAAYHQWLTPAQFTDQFGPTTGSVQTATTWAKGASLTVESVSVNRTLVTLSGTRAELGRAFGVQLREVTLAGSTYVTPDRTAVLPTALRTVSAAVLNLTTYNPARLHTVVRGKAAAPAARTAASPYQTYGLASYDPNDFKQIYNAPAASTGTGQTVAVITQGRLDGVKSDLAVFEKKFGLPVVPMTVVETTAPKDDVSGADEYDLDTQYSTGFAEGVSGVTAYNSATLGGIEPLNAFVNDKTGPLTASASYGGCETINYAVGRTVTDDAVFMQADAEGKSFWVSSGDEGSACSLVVNTGTPAGVPDVEYPSSSPYVVAVGGTSLTGQSAQPTREITWLGGGGGYSAVENAAPWQVDTTTALPQELGRGVPDVSLDADPQSGYVVVVAGVATDIGGTSASAPAWNGIWARVLQRNPTIGFAAPALYAAKAGITDITVGTNGLYPATPGYDLSTGLGSADITALVNGFTKK